MFLNVYVAIQRNGRMSCLLSFTPRIEFQKKYHLFHLSFVPIQPKPIGIPKEISIKTKNDSSHERNMQ